MDPRRYNPNTVTGELSKADYTAQAIPVPAPFCDGILADIEHRVNALRERIGCLATRVYGPRPEDAGQNILPAHGGFHGRLQSVNIILGQAAANMDEIEKHI